MLFSLALTIIAYIPGIGSFPFLISVVLLVFFLTILVIDLEHRVVLKEVTITGLIFLPILMTIFSFNYQGFGFNLVNPIIGGIVGFLIMLVFYYLGILYVKWMAKRRRISPDEIAFGFGDVTTSALIGFVAGWPNILPVVLLGVLSGGLISALIIVIMLIMKKYQAMMAIPYTPFLILAMFVIMFLQA
jgi:prepilin signal peptidase PulO-like enzyme (type II secretory pathway)